MKGKKIKGVGDGDEDSDAVNYKQLIDHIKINRYYYYTKELQHNNGRIAFFPAINKYPFESFYLFHEGTSNKIKNALRIQIEQICHSISTKQMSGLQLQSISLHDLIVANI